MKSSNPRYQGAHLLRNYKPSRTLIHRQWLGQIPREIRFKPAPYAHMIREKLQRQDFWQIANIWPYYAHSDSQLISEFEITTNLPFVVN